MRESEETVDEKFCVGGRTDGSARPWARFFGLKRSSTASRASFAACCVACSFAASPSVAAPVVPPIYRAIDLGPIAEGGVGLGMKRMGMNEFCAVTATRATTLPGGSIVYSGTVWLPPSLRPPVTAGVTPPDEFDCYPLPTPVGSTHAWACDVNLFGVVVGASGEEAEADCDATRWTTGYFSGLIASEQVGAVVWSAFVGLSEGPAPYAVGVKAIDCKEDWHPYAYDFVPPGEIPVPMPLLPGNAPFNLNHVVEVAVVRRELTAIDRNAAFWTAQCSDGSMSTNCDPTWIPANSPKLDTSGYSAPFPTLLLELPSVVSPVHSNLVEATWASGVNDFGQVCGAIDKLSEGTSQTEQWQPCVWSSSPGSASGAVALIPLHCSNITVTTEDLEALQLAHAAVGTSVEAMAAWHPDCEYEMLGYEITCECVKCVYVLLKDDRAGQGGNQ